MSKEKEEEWSLENKSRFLHHISIILIGLPGYFKVDRVKWFRDRADRDRVREEVEILEAEFERTVLSHTRMADVWTQLAGAASGPGAAAYAHKKTCMYRGLAKECSEAYGIALKKAGRPLPPKIG